MWRKRLEWAAIAAVVGGLSAVVWTSWTASQERQRREAEAKAAASYAAEAARAGAAARAAAAASATAAARADGAARTAAMLAAVNEQGESVDQVKAKAMRGDYQAQRNLAFGYSSFPYKGQDKNAMLACAWRVVLINSGSERVDATDISNAKVECGGLGQLELIAAQAQARTLFHKVYGREMD